MPRAARDLAKQPVEAQHAGPEHRSALGQLALRVLDILERGNDENRLVVEARPQPAQHLTRLGGVRGTGYEG